MSHDTDTVRLRHYLACSNHSVDRCPCSTYFEDAAMNRARVTQTINAMETAYQNILEHVPPGTPGKLDAVMKLRQRADDLFIEYATTRINHERTNYPAA